MRKTAIVIAFLLLITQVSATTIQVGLGVDHLEINERIGDVIPSITAKDIPELESKTISMSHEILAYQMHSLSTILNSRQV